FLPFTSIKIHNSALTGHPGTGLLGVNQTRRHLATTYKDSVLYTQTFGGQGALQPTQQHLRQNSKQGDWKGTGQYLRVVQLIKARVNIFSIPACTNDASERCGRDDLDRSCAYTGRDDREHKRHLNASHNLVGRHADPACRVNGSWINTLNASKGIHH